MAEKQCDLIKNGGGMIDDKLFVESITVTAGAAGLNNRSVMYSIATRLSSLLDSLPDGYICEFVCVNNQTPIDNYIYDTTGTGHAVNIRTLAANIVSGAVVWATRLYDTTWGSVNISMVQISTSGTVTNTDQAGTIVVNPNTSTTMEVHYRLNKAQ